jgi:ribosomal protein S18 acetylase RimI-like enzyme
MIVRELRDEDVPALAALATELGYPASQDAVRERLTRLRALPEQALLGAEVDGVLCGYLCAQPRRSLEDEGSMEIVALVVARHARRSGAGRALVADAAKHAHALGYPRLRVRSNVARMEAHSFYHALGFTRTKTQHCYQRVIDSSSTP